MAAPLGNQFWKLGAENIGRPTHFATAQDMWDKACEYFQWCDDNPLKSYEWNGKDPVKCELLHMRPYTIKGFCLFAGVNEAYLRTFNSESDKDFPTIIARIYDTCYTQKFEGAVSGLMNANIISRDLGLADNQNNNFSGTLSGDVKHTVKFENYKPKE